MKKALLIRFGGLGDMAPMSVVGEQLKKRGYHVVAAMRDDGGPNKGSELFKHSDCFDETINLVEVGPWGTRCLKTKLGYASVNTIYQDFDMVLDYMNIVEGNSTSPMRQDKVGYEWQASRSSNWVNWYDLHLAWANIDPTSVPDAEKRPIFKVTDEEKSGILGLKEGHSHLITIQASASSISRTWFQAKQLPDLLIKKYPNALVAFWEASVASWILVSAKGATRLVSASLTPLRASMAIVAASALFIGADSGFSHVAEGLNIPNIAIYSTVPAWTRNKYYKHQITVDHGKTNPEFYTFNLGLGDPLRTIEGLQNLTEREKLIEEMHKRGAGVKEAAAALNTDPEGAGLELESFLRKKASFDRQQSKALSGVTVDEVLALVDGVLKPVGKVLPVKEEVLA